MENEEKNGKTEEGKRKENMNKLWRKEKNEEGKEGRNDAWKREEKYGRKGGCEEEQEERR